MEFLLDQGADPNDQADCGATALHYAAECGHSEICSFLLKYDAVIMKNVNGELVSSATHFLQLDFQSFGKSFRFFQSQIVNWEWNWIGFSYAINEFSSIWCFCFVCKLIKARKKNKNVRSPIKIEENVKSVKKIYNYHRLKYNSCQNENEKKEEREEK